MTGAQIEALAAERMPSLLKLAQRNTRSLDDAHEAVARALLQLAIHGHRLGPEPGRWLQKVTIRAAWAVGRGHGPCEALGEQPDPADPHRAVITAIETRRLMLTLKPDERTALSLQAIGLSLEEIGEAQGWTHTKVNRCIYEGRARLRSLAPKEATHV